MSKKSMLVTGGCGFIGSNFVKYILKKYPTYKVHVLDLLTYAGFIENIPLDSFSDRLSFTYGCITNENLVQNLVSSVDCVVHFAAESHVTRSIHDNVSFFRTDVLGTQSVASAVHKNIDRIEKFIHISTSEVYGTAVTEKMDENHPLDPKSPYAAAKVGADRLVQSYYYTYGIPSVIIRPFNNYGPQQHLEKAIPRFITNIIRNKPIRVHGDGSPCRDYVFVEDTCLAIDAIIHANNKDVCGNVFNVGSEKHRSIKSMAEDIVNLMGKGTIEYSGDRPGQVERHTADCSKIMRMFGWKPRISWEQGLKKTISWYNKSKNFWKKQIWMSEIPIVTAKGKREIH